MTERRLNTPNCTKLVSRDENGVGGVLNFVTKEDYVKVKAVKLVDPSHR